MKCAASAVVILVVCAACGGEGGTDLPVSKESPLPRNEEHPAADERIVDLRDPETQRLLEIAKKAFDNPEDPAAMADLERNAKKIEQLATAGQKRLLRLFEDKYAGHLEEIGPLYVVCASAANMKGPAPTENEREKLKHVAAAQFKKARDSGLSGELDAQRWADQHRAALLETSVRVLTAVGREYAQRDETTQGLFRDYALTFCTATVKARSRLKDPKHIVGSGIMAQEAVGVDPIKKYATK